MFMKHFNYTNFAVTATVAALAAPFSLTTTRSSFPKMRKPQAESLSP